MRTGLQGAGDRGSASIWLLAGASLVLVVAMAVTVRTTAVVARHRAESAADLAALAAAAAIGVADDSEAVCAAAGPIAEANGASLTSCAPAIDPDGRTGSVTVRVTVLAHLPGWGVVRTSATARAGRLPAPSRGPEGTAP